LAFSHAPSGYDCDFCGNVLVVPNRHVENIFELDGRLAAAVHDRAGSPPR
jgi:hypothetical protein